MKKSYLSDFQWSCPTAMQQRADGHWASESCQKWSLAPSCDQCNAPWLEHHLSPPFYGVVKMTWAFQAVGEPTIDITLLSGRCSFNSNNLMELFESHPMSTLTQHLCFKCSNYIQIKNQGHYSSFNWSKKVQNNWILNITRCVHIVRLGLANESFSIHG